MRIVQLTDLHYTKNKLPLDQLISDLQEQNIRKPIDLVLITGDLVDQGGTSFPRTDYYKVIEEKVIKRIYQSLNLSKHDILIVPGNHDITQRKINQLTYNGLVGSLRTLDEINDHVSRHAKSYHSGLKGLENYNKYEKNRYQRRKNSYLSNYESAFVFNYEGINIGIAAFNSAWSCNKDNTDRIFFGTQQIHNVGEFFQKPKIKTVFNIGMIHHPLDVFHIQEAVEAEKLLKEAGFNLLLCGHTHQDCPTKFQRKGGELLISVARSAFNNNREKPGDFQSGYRIIDFGYSRDEYIDIIINYRKFAQAHHFDYDTDSGERAGAETFPIQVTAKNRKFYEILKQKNQLLTEERKRVFEELSSKTKMMLESSYPIISDQVLESINRKILSFKGFDHYREDIKLEFTVEEYDKDHASIEEKQVFDIISTGKGFEYKINAYVEIEDGRNDKSDLRVTKLRIDGRDYTGQVKYHPEYLKSNNEKGTKVGITRKKVLLSKKLPGKAIYHVERTQTSVHCLKSNGIWKTTVGTIVKGIKVNIKNRGNYKVDLVEFGNNTNFARDIKGIGTIKRGEDIQAVHEGILMPGDGFMIVVNSL